MTCREKLMLEHPECVGDPNKPGFDGGCLYCPDDYGYLEIPEYCGDGSNNKITCAKCWDREIPSTERIHVSTLITEKESNTMKKKTEAQLIEEINANMRDIHELKQELAKLEKYREYEKAANELRAFYEALVNAGFTEAQAWELFMAATKLAPKVTG